MISLDEPGARQPKAPAPMAASAWDPFRHRTFAVVWSVTVVANIGGWMYTAAAGWLMTSLNADPLMVSLVQVATSLPMCLLAIPAGALADILDKRRFIMGLEIVISVVSAMFALLVTADLASPATLLLFTFVIGVCGALEAPAWQSIVPQLVPRQDLPQAVAVNSVGVNISRAIGPAVGGVMIAGFGVAAPFWLDAVSNFGVIGAMLWWRPPPKRGSDMPAERFVSAIRTGFRYARYNSHLRATLARAMGFFLFGSAYWALLPLVARSQIAGGPQLYGVLLGAIGAGAVAGAFALPRLKAKIGADWLVAAGESGTVVTLLMFGIAREPMMALAASVIAGVSWIAVLTSLNVSAQLALPDWVRGRGLAMYVTVFFGGVTIGSAIWGQVAAMVGLPLALIIAAVGMLIAIPLTWRWKLQTGAGIDLTPSMHWPTPIVSDEVDSHRGPVLVTVEYRVAAKDREGFLVAVNRLARERCRDGAYAWGIFEDTAEPGRFVETFLLESWLEHLYQHERVTNADRALEDQVHRYLADSDPVITHFIAAEPAREPGNGNSK